MLNFRQMARYRKAPRFDGKRRARLGRYLLLFSIGVALPGLFFLASRAWVAYRIRNDNQAWMQRSDPMVDLVMKTWDIAHFPPISTGDELLVRERLKEFPFLVAVASAPATRLWVREGDRLRPGGPEEAYLLDWVKQAQANRIRIWHPSEAEHTSHQVEMVTVFSDAEGSVVQRWRIGSPEVEAGLRSILGEHSPLGIGIQRRGLPRPAPAPPKPWGRAPNLQTDIEGEVAQGIIHSPLHSISVTGEVLGKQWQLWGLLSWEQIHRLQRLRRVWYVEAFGTSLVAMVALWVSLYLQHRAHERGRLDLDRMAAMTHSLKTPLAVMKLRCDSVRLGLLDPIRTETELAQLGIEVDHLAQFVEQSLAGLRGDMDPGSRAVLPSDWIAAVAADMEPLFEEQDRALTVELEPVVVAAHPPSLRSAIVTLLENALAYGKGPVDLRMRRQGKRVLLEVRNDGTGLDSGQMKRLATPFMRFRQQGSEGFPAEGMGLGLFLLVQAASREGWGLRFASDPGEGFLAQLELPLG